MPGGGKILLVAQLIVAGVRGLYVGKLDESLRGKPFSFRGGQKTMNF